MSRSFWAFSVHPGSHSSMVCSERPKQTKSLFSTYSEAWKLVILLILSSNAFYTKNKMRIQVQKLFEFSAFNSVKVDVIIECIIVIGFSLRVALLSIISYLFVLGSKALSLVMLPFDWDQSLNT